MIANGQGNPADDAGRLLAALRVAVKAARTRRRHTQALVAQMLGTNAAAISTFERGLSTTQSPALTIGLMRYCGWTINVWTDQ